MPNTVVRSAGQLVPLRDEWEELASRAATPMLDYDWTLSAAEAFCPDGALHVVLVRARGGLQAAAPLALERGPRGSRLALLGVSALYEPGGWLSRSDEALGELACEVLHQNRPIVLQRVPEDSAVCRALRGVSPAKGLVVDRRVAGWLGVHTAGPWHEYAANLSTRITENLPRLARRAERDHGSMRIDHLEPRLGDVADVLRTVSDIEGSGWKGRRGSALAHRPALFDFFHRYCRRIADRGQLRVSLLSLGGAVAAVELAVEAYGRHWQLKIGFREELSAFYPGLQLVLASVRRSFERRLASYEFLGVAEPWEHRWRPQERPCRLFLAYPTTLAGLAGAWHDVGGVLRNRLRPARLREARA